MAPAVARTPLGSQALEISTQGLGCIGMSALYGPPKPELDMIALVHHAIDSGITFLDTSDVYGPFTNEVLRGKGIRHKVQLATKFGIKIEDGQFNTTIRGDSAYVHAACKASLKRLDVDYIDLYYQHRVDTKVPIEVTVREPFKVGEMKKLVEEGKVKYRGLSEASASTIRRAHAVHPITAVQLEWSLWSRDVEKDIIPTCRDLGIEIVAYSPLGQGFFFAGAKILEGTSETDYHKTGQPRMEGGNLEKNHKLFQALAELASRKGCTPGMTLYRSPAPQESKILRKMWVPFMSNLAKPLELQEIEAFFDGAADRRGSL